MLTITKIFNFSAAHRLPEHNGKCKNLHGHTYKLEVTVGGSPLHSIGSSRGMIMDFGDLKAIVEKEILNDLDHSYLNKIYDVPTAEYMVISIFGKLCLVIPNLKRVRLWETDTAYAEAEAEV